MEAVACALKKTLYVRTQTLIVLLDHAIFRYAAYSLRFVIFLSMNPSTTCLAKLLELQ